MSASITPKTNGPIRIEGNFKLVDMTGKEFDLAGRTAISLCRCGQSTKKPFCDGTHNTCGFDSMIVAQVVPPPAPKPQS